jgi:hypothetical protein
MAPALLDDEVEAEGVMILVITRHDRWITLEESSLAFAAKALFPAAIYSTVGNLLIGGQARRRGSKPANS